MLQNLKNLNKGFTIVEVMIVLAIGGMIMLIVFLAVPALQRNSRNNQRTADASRTAAAVNECLANTNGTVASCGIGGIDPTYIDIASNSQLTGTGGATVDGLALAWGAKCNQAGTASETAGAGAKSFTITYEVETRGAAADRCIGS